METTPAANDGEPTARGALGVAHAVLVTMRPRQWVKNLFALAPLVFSKSLTDPALALRAGGAVAAFCLLSGAVYAFNDVRDAAADRRHPRKRQRPIAAGLLGERTALVAAALLAAASLGAMAALSLALAAVALGYLANNLAYSLGLKRFAFLDVALIAGGFLLRVWAGGLAIDVPVSPWLLVLTGLLAALLGLGKRAHELVWAERAAVTPQGTRPIDRFHTVTDTRASLAGYRVHSLRWAMGLLALATAAGYALYTQDEHTVRFFGTRRLLFTLPFCLFGIGRFLQLAVWRPREDSPTDAVLRDWPFLLCLAAWGATVLAIIYGG
jgi:4-hydroxybenzoate polyprenyltransferase